MTLLHVRYGLGVRISMDDFGTGYSSLNYLLRFPFDKIKIDRSFISELREAPEDTEGVETAEQFAQVRRKGCTEVQGYFVGRPRPADEIEALRQRLDVTKPLIASGRSAAPQLVA